jgi:hypothetical protein
MTGGQWLAVLGGAVAGFLVALVWVRYAIERAPARLLRTNVEGARVPAVLGLPVVAGCMVGAGVVYATDHFSNHDLTTTRAALAVLVVVLVAAGAGYFDDRRGDETERGFAGHARAAFRGRVTGGLVKIAGVGLAGIAAGLLLGGGWLFTLECAALVGLTANFVNLLDRAPGRAGKVALVGTIPLLAFGWSPWATAAAGIFGAVTACLGADLRARAMLGDAGANPIGAVLGLGLATSLDRGGRVIALVVLLAINLASERWSFSRGIERVSWLNALDRWGRA